MDLPRREQLFRIFAASLVDANDQIALSAVLSDGTDANMIANGCAAMGEEVIAQLAEVAAGQFLDTASGPTLIRRGSDRHQILPRPAAPAFVDLTFTLAVAQALPFTIPSGTTIKSADGRTYFTVEDVTFPAASTTLTDVRARSQLAGRSQIVGAGKLTSITSTIPGAPAGLTVTNPAASTGGVEAENEDDYKARCRREPAARARGTKRAIEFGALSVPGVIRANAFEGIDVNGRANRIANLVIADEFVDALVRQGVSIPAYESQSQAFARVVEQRLDDWRAFGIYVSVVVAQVIPVSILMRLRFRAGADTARAKIQAMATVVRKTNGLAPGATWDPADMVEALRSVSGLMVMGDEFENPAGPIVTSSPYQVFRTAPALIQYTSQPSITGAVSVLTTALGGVPLP